MVRLSVLTLSIACGIAQSSLAFLPCTRFATRNVPAEIRRIKSLPRPDDGVIPFDIPGDGNYARANDFEERQTMSRPSFLRSLGLFPAGIALTGNGKAASARGLVRFPCVNGLMNTYHIMRAGQSLLEEEDVWSTNPLFLTNRECALSQLGIEQVEETCRALNEKGVTPTLVRYSLAANAVDTANIVGRDLRIGRDRVVPEFFFLDPRAVGLWDNLPLRATEAAVWAMDADEAGPDGTGGRPPPNEDSTPHETLSDQVPRLTQLLSALETQFSGDTVLLIFPDGTGPALLTALIGGIPLNRVHELNFRPGEVRLDVNYDTASMALPDEPDAAYTDILERGRKELKALRENPDGIVNVKDQKYAEEIKADAELATKRAEAAAAKEEAERSAREERALKLERDRQQKRLLGMDGDAGSENINASPIVTSLVALGALGVGSLAVGNEEEASLESPANGAGNETIANASNIALNVEIGGTEKAPMNGSTIRSINGVPVAEVSPLDLDGPKKDEKGALPTSPLYGEGSSKDGASQDPYKEAEEAMKNYMDQDDGGDAWLEMLSDIMRDEESEPEPKPSSSNSN